MAKQYPFRPGRHYKKIVMKIDVEPSEIDYKLLLRKYISLIKSYESIDYIEKIDHVYPPLPEPFTTEEITELKRLSSEIKEP